MESILPNQLDVERLRANPDATARLTLAQKLGRSYSQRLFKPRERAVADEIVRAIAHDVEVEVRRALAQTISSSSDLPADVAVKLAQDVIEVAEPILRESDLLDDSVLVEIIHSRTNEHRRAVAARARVSEPVAAAIIDLGDAPAVSTLVSNAGARISEPSLGVAVERFSDETTVTEPLADREALPLAIAERLVALVSDRLRARFAGSSARARRYAENLATQVAEGAALILGGGEAETLDLLALVDQLQAAGKLQPSLVIRAGHSGEIDLMQAAVSRLCGKKYAAVAAAFSSDAGARALLADVGLIPAEIDSLMSARQSASARLN